MEREERFVALGWFFLIDLLDAILFNQIPRNTSLEFTHIINPPFLEVSRLLLSCNDAFVA